MKKTIRKYLEERREMAWQNRFNLSANYLMTEPVEGMEEQFAVAVRDCEIVDELLELVQEYPTSDDPDISCDDSGSVFVKADKRIPYQPWSKDVAERAFQNICQHHRNAICKSCAE